MITGYYLHTWKKYCSTPKILWDFWYIIWSTKLHKFLQVSFLLQLVVGFVKIELDWLDYNHMMTLARHSEINDM